MTHDEIVQLAKRGAAADVADAAARLERAKQILAEVGPRQARTSPQAKAAAESKTVLASTNNGHGRTVSKAQRKAIGIRMRKYWADRRKADRAAERKTGT